MHAASLLYASLSLGCLIASVPEGENLIGLTQLFMLKSVIGSGQHLSEVLLN